MPELDPQTLSDLSSLAARTQPTAAAKQRMLTSLEAQLGAGPGGGGSAATGSAGLGYAAKVVAVTLAMTGVGLLGLRVGANLLHTDTPGSAQTPAAVATTVAKDEPRSATPPVQPKMSPVVAAVTEPTAELPAAKLEGHEVESGAAHHSAPLSSADQLTRELEIIRAARAAHDPKARLAELDRHRLRFASGQLADERELMRVEVLCELGRLKEARGALAQVSDAGLRAEMRSSCPVLD